MGKAGKQIARAAGYGSVYLGGQLAGGIITGVFATAKTIKEFGKGVTPGSEEFKAAYMEHFSSMSGIMVAIAAAITLIFLAVFFLIRREKMSEAVNFRKVSAKAAGLSAIVGIALNIVTMAFLRSLPESILAGYAESSSGLMNQKFGLAILSTVIAAPIIEEIIFRGLIYDRLKKGIPTVVAIIISSLLFGLAHGQPVWICYTTVMGITLAIIYNRTNSIAATIASHLAYNFTSVLLGSTILSLPIAAHYAIAAVGLAVAIVIFVKTKNVGQVEQKTDIKVSTIAL